LIFKKAAGAVSMKELEYPFDAGYILGSKRKLKRMLLGENEKFIDKKVAILGGSTTSEIKNIMELFLLNNGIRPAFYESEYNRYYEDAVFPNEELAAFMPDVIYIHTSNRNITRYPSIADSEETIQGMLHNEFDKFREIWSSLSAKYHCPIIQNNFEMPYFRLLGNRDASDIHGRINYLTKLNLLFYEYAGRKDNFFICDINYISADYGLKEWSDPFYWHMYKYALCVPAIPFLAQNIANIIKSIFGRNKKGMVLDLDNTLWGGIIGEEGPDNIKIGPEEAGGSVYTEFQDYIKAQKDLGILLAIDSKNEEGNAVAGLNHPQSRLHPEDFVKIAANWEPKDRNFAQIASSINLLPESLVFVDDNPAERHIVTERFPGVSAPDMGESHHYIRNLDRNGFFEVTALSDDDAKRNEMYRANAERERFQESFADYGEYLQSLKMTAVIKEFEPAYTARISQLSNKSNQFNLTTKRYTKSEIDSISKDADYITLYGKLEDRFGDNGVVSVIIGKVKEDCCCIDLWIMSCRVLKRDMECAMMDALVRACRKRNIHQIKGFYYPTAKNHMVADFYMTQGFKKVDEDSDGNTAWLFEITSDYKPHNKFINTEVSQ